MATPLFAGVVVRKPAAAVNPISESLALASTSKVVDLSGDSIADVALIARESQQQQVVFAVGPDATNAAVQSATKATIVAIGVPNPGKVAGNAAFISVYPKYEKVFEYAGARLKAKKVAFLFSPAQNRETAAEFEKAAAAKGITFVPTPVGSSGELVRILKETIPAVDALILAVDPLIFDRLNLRFIVETASSQGKPTIGFLPELAAFGVTVALSLDPNLVVAAAVEEGKRGGARRVRQIDSAFVTVSRKSADRLGLQMESLGANKVQ